MSKKAFKIAVIESESGWGRKIDDWMVCLTSDAVLEFKKKFNAKNNLDVVPEWYMVVEGEPVEIEITDKQYKLLNKHKKVWLSMLKTYDT